MGLLDHLWDDTVAGPRPESGLGKLRKHHTFTFRPSSGNDQTDSPPVEDPSMKVTRSIMIVKPPGYQAGGSAPCSPAGSTPPVSPFSEQTQGERNPFGLGDGPLRRHQDHHRRVDQGALLLLTACDL